MFSGLTRMLRFYGAPKLIYGILERKGVKENQPGGRCRYTCACFWNYCLYIYRGDLTRCSLCCLGLDVARLLAPGHGYHVSQDQWGTAVNGSEAPQMYNLIWRSPSLFKQQQSKQQAVQVGVGVSRMLHLLSY